MDDRYFEFLCDFVGDYEDRTELLRDLHGVKFYSLIPNDENRGRDGEMLRDIFLDDEGQHALYFSDFRPPSLLETLVGLSIRIEFETSQSVWERSPGQWFWILIDNLGLSDSTNDNYDREKVISCASDLLERRYGRDGNGGLFPLKKPKKDQRRVELWYQMSAYIQENYPI